MLRVTVELVSAIHPSRNRVLGIAHIANDSVKSIKSQHNLGDYDVVLFDKAGKPWRTGRVENFPRKRLLGWDLVYRALVACKLEGRK